MKIKCYDILQMVLEEACKRFAPQLQPDEARLHELEAYCGWIDRLLETNEGEEFSCEIDEVSGAILLSAVLGDLIVKPGEDSFLHLTKATSEIKMEWESEESIRVNFSFPSIWKYVE